MDEIESATLRVSLNFLAITQIAFVKVIGNPIEIFGSTPVDRKISIIVRRCGIDLTLKGPPTEFEVEIISNWSVTSLIFVHVKLGLLRLGKTRIFAVFTTFLKI
jgi:hypothetical protein